MARFPYGEESPAYAIGRAEAKIKIGAFVTAA
jgi:hypothetical protein